MRYEIAVPPTWQPHLPSPTLTAPKFSVPFLLFFTLKVSEIRARFLFIPWGRNDGGEITTCRVNQLITQTAVLFMATLTKVISTEPMFIWVIKINSYTIHYILMPRQLLLNKTENKTVKFKLTRITDTLRFVKYCVF